MSSEKCMHTDNRTLHSLATIVTGLRLETPGYSRWSGCKKKQCLMDFQFGRNPLLWKRDAKTPNASLDF